MKYMGQVSIVRQSKTLHWIPPSGDSLLRIELAPTGVQVWKLPDPSLVATFNPEVVYAHPVDLTNCDMPVVLAFLAGAGVLPLVGNGPSDFDVSPAVARCELELAQQAVAELRESDDAESHAVADTIERNIPALQRYAG